MYAEVVVLTYQAPDINSFTYEIPKELEKEIKIGQLVEVPFGKRSPQGIVVEIHNKKPQVTTKPISKIVLENPLLFPYQIELVKWMSNYYLAPMVNCLNAILPELPRKLLMVYPDSRRVHGSWKKENITTNYELSTMNQHLILVPTINRIPETMAKFPKAKNYVVYHNELKPPEKFAAWQKILAGYADFIFGSRSAIFAPFPALKEIIIYNENDQAYKDERSPYFDSLTVAQKISELSGSQIKIVDPAPKISTYFALKNHIKMQQFETKTEIVSMENERLSGNKTPLSDYLLDNIKANIKRGKSALLFLNKKKESGQLFCRSCKHQQFSNNQPNLCPNCQSPDIFFGSLNINSLATLLQKQLPSTKINLITEKSPATSEKNIPTIDIATTYIFYTFIQKKYALSGYISCDPLLNRADFTSTETLFAQIANLKQLTEKSGQIILQSYNPQNRTLEFAASGNYGDYFLDQLAQRKALNYPPFGLLAKLHLKGKDPQKTKVSADNLFSKLQSEINDDRLSVLGPYQSIFWQKNPTYNIILKYKLKGYSQAEKEKAVAKIKSFIGSLPKGWQITVDPSSIN
jgi:primosomal protein N' (replication factor Y)